VLQRITAGTTLHPPSKLNTPCLGAALFFASSAPRQTRLPTEPLLSQPVPPALPSSLQVLRVLQRRVLAPRAGLAAATQAEVFTDAALQQLAAIAAAAAVEGEEAEGGEAGEEGGPGKEEGRRAREAAAAAHSLLLALATQPAHGLVAPPAATPCAPRFTLEETGRHQLQPGQRRLLRLLLRLRPADSAAHLQLLLAAAAADAPVAAALLLALPYSLEPAAASAAAGSAAAGRWFVHAAVAARLLQLLPAAAPPGLAAAAGGGAAAPAPGGRRAQALLRCCFPPCLSKAALSRGLQHSGALVRHGTLSLLISCLSALQAVLQDCAAAAQLAAAQKQQQQQGRQDSQGWLALAEWLRAGVRRLLPDPTLLLALLVAAEKEGWEAGEAPGSVVSATARFWCFMPEFYVVSGFPHHTVCPPGSSPPAAPAANELQLSAVLRALLLWQRTLPAALAEAHVDAARLLPAQPLALRPPHQLLLLELLHAAADAAEAGAEADAGISNGAATATTAGQDAAAGGSPAPPQLLLPVLRLLAGPGVAAAVRGAARGWLLRWLLGCGAFGGNEEEAVLWLDLLPRWGAGMRGRVTG
jgi:nucleolar pre-ribosomal-associated protein 1